MYLMMDKQYSAIIHMLLLLLFLFLFLLLFFPLFESPTQEVMATAERANLRVCWRFGVGARSRFDNMSWGMIFPMTNGG